MCIMALQVWLPLNGNLNNQGLSNVTVTNNGATVDNNGKIGKCYKFNNNYITGNTGPLTTSTQNFSIAFWVKYDNLNNAHCMYSQRTVTGEGITVWKNGNHIRFDDGSNMWETSYIFTVNVWTHVVVTRNSSQKKLYINGQLKDTGSSGTLRNISTKFYIGKSSSNNDSYTPSNNPLYGYLNDLRVYDHCLSPKEVHSISQALILHYKLDANDISLSPNLITGFNSGGQTTISGNNIVINGNNSDTYFIIKTSKTLVLNKQYKLSCIGNGFSNNSYYNFPIAAQSNTSPGVIKIQNGYCELVFIANDVIVNAGTTILMDDSGRSPSAGTITNIVLQEYDNIIYDCSGYKHDANVIGLLNFNNDSPRYNSCIKNTNEYPCKSMTSIDFPISSGLTICCWVNLTTWGVQTSGLWATSNLSTDPTDYNTTTCNHRDSGFDMRGTNGTTYRLTCDVTDIPINIWKHIVVTHDGANAKLYINGTLIRTLALPSSLVAFNYLYLGYSKAGGVIRKCQGSWSDFRIYATALSEQDVKSLYNIGAVIDNGANIHTYEYHEIESTTPKVHRTGVTDSSAIIEPDTIINASFNKEGIIKSRQFYEV